MAPVNRNRNWDQKSTSVRRRGKNSSRKAHKYSNGTDGSRIRKRVACSRLETTVGRNGNAKSRKTGAGSYSKMAKDGKRRTSDTNELRTKKYVRKALELGLSAGYLIPDANSDGQVFRVASEIVKFGRFVEEANGSDEKPDDAVGRDNDGRRGGRTTGGKRLPTKIKRANLGKRGRSRTKSPKRPVAQKRRRKQSNGRPKVKARIQKRKRMPEAKNDEPRTRKNEDDADDDNGDNDNDNNENDEDDEPDTEDNGNKNSSDDNKKMPVAGRPGTIVPNSNDNPPTSPKEKNEDNKEQEGSGEERSSEDGDEEDEDGDDLEQPEGLEAEEDANEDNEEQRADN